MANRATEDHETDHPADPDEVFEEKHHDGHHDRAKDFYHAGAPFVFLASLVWRDALGQYTPAVSHAAANAPALAVSEVSPRYALRGLAFPGTVGKESPVSSPG